MRDFIHWEDFRPVLGSVTGYDTKDWRKGGRRPFDPLLVFKILALQKYHGLSDEATEAQIRDRLSFMSFLGLRLGDEGLIAKEGSVVDASFVDAPRHNNLCNLVYNMDRYSFLKS